MWNLWILIDELSRDEPCYECFHRLPIWFNEKRNKNMNLRTKMKTTIFERFKRRFSYFSLSFAEPLYICFRTIRFDHPQTHRKQNHRMQHSIHRWILFFGFEFSEQLIPKNPLFSHFIYYHCYRLLPTSNLKDKRTKNKKHWTIVERNYNHRTNRFYATVCNIHSTFLL